MSSVTLRDRDSGHRVVSDTATAQTAVLTGRDGGQRHLRALVPRPRRVHPGHDRGRLGGPGGTGPERGWCL